MSHSVVGASGHHRWGNCPGSVLFEAECGVLDEESFPAKEGSCAHQLADNCLHNGVSTHAYLGHLLYSDIPVDDEMAVHIQGYVDFCRTLPGQVFIEWVFHLPEIHKLMFGTLDFAAINWSERVLRLCDLKYGFVEVLATDGDVDARNNGQLMYYAFALIVAMGLAGKIDHVVLGIYQPRLWQRENPLDTVTLTVDEILAWGYNTLVPQMDAAMDPSAIRVAGKHCKYCRGKMTCPEFLSQLGTLQGPFPTEPAAVAQLLSLEGPAKQMFKDAQKDATRRLNSGQKVPGYKPVRSVGRRKITNPDAIAAAAQAIGVDVPKLYERKMIGITAMEKIPGMKEVINKVVVKPTYGIKAAPIESTQPAVAVGFGNPNL